jgi:hypothetical protein
VSGFRSPGFVLFLASAFLFLPVFFPLSSPLGFLSLSFVIVIRVGLRALWHVVAGGCVHPLV